MMISARIDEFWPSTPSPRFGARGRASASVGHDCGRGRHHRCPRSGSRHHLGQRPVPGTDTVKRENGAGIIVGGILVGAIILAAVALAAMGTTRTETSRSSSVALGNPDDNNLGDVVVIGKSQSGGNSIFGIHFGHVTYSVSVHVIAAPGCFEAVNSGDRWPTSIEGCSIEADIEGEIGGGGISATGDSIIGVVFEVSRQCFDITAVGDTWPPSQSGEASQTPASCATISP